MPLTLLLALTLLTALLPIARLLLALATLAPVLGLLPALLALTRLIPLLAIPILAIPILAISTVLPIEGTASQLLHITADTFGLI